VAAVPGQDIGRGEALAEVVGQRGEGGPLQDQQQVGSRIDLRVVFGLLRNAEERIDLRQQRPGRRRRAAPR
jgi:hypothetical protein